MSRILAAMAPVAVAIAPTVTISQDTTPVVSRRAAVPFAAGERFEYDVRGALGIHLGRASMEVVGIDTVRGTPAWHTLFQVKGGTFFFKVNDRYESWFDVTNFASLRYIQDIDEGNYERKREYLIFPERRVFHEAGKLAEEPSVEFPLDDCSFIFFVRTLPLEVGKEYTFDRYFRPDRNPVRIKVLGREQIKVPAGTFDAIVVQPIIKAKGLFSEGGNARVWFSADDRRIMLQMKSELPFGSLNLYLKSHRATNPPAAQSGR